MKLIDKDRIVVEIERRLNYRVESLKAINDGTYWKEEQSEDEFNESLARCAFNAAKNELFELKCFLDTLEVKGVGLEKHLKEDIENVFFDLNGVAVKGATYYLTVEDVKDIAKHFFELGLSASNKAQKGE